VAANKGFRVRIQSLIKLVATNSEPQPDIAWVVSKRYRIGHPTAADIRLLIEVAYSSLESDSTEKALLYAEAGIKDYWIVNVIEQAITVYRDPRSDGYRSIQTFGAGESVNPLALREASLSVDWLFDDAE
jgi:Uma2 family endonuclease